MEIGRCRGSHRGRMIRAISGPASPQSSARSPPSARPRPVQRAQRHVFCAPVPLRLIGREPFFINGGGRLLVRNKMLRVLKCLQEHGSMDIRETSQPGEFSAYSLKVPHELSQRRRTKRHNRAPQLRPEEATPADAGFCLPGPGHFVFRSCSRESGLALPTLFGGCVDALHEVFRQADIQAQGPGADLGQVDIDQYPVSAFESLVVFPALG